MWRYQLIDLSEQHIRQLRLLIKLKRAEAHVIVRTDQPWPPEILLHPRQHDAKVARDAIN